MILGEEIQTSNNLVLTKKITLELAAPINSCAKVPFVYIGKV